MQLADVLCYIVLTITVTASCTRAEEQNKETEESQDIKRINKREATLIYDFNGGPMDKIFNKKPKVIYRKISKVRFEPPKSRYGSSKSQYGPPRPKYKPHKSTRKPGKKSRTGKPISSSPRYIPPEPRNRHSPYPNKKHNKNKMRPNGRPGFGHVVKMPHYSFFVPEKTSFGEPPVPKDQRPPKSYGEPPVDSYGAPLKPGVVDVYPTQNSYQNIPTKFPDSSHQNDFLDHNNQEQQKNHNYIDTGFDTSYAFTKKEPTYSNYVTVNPKDAHVDLMSPADRTKNAKFFFRKLKPHYFADAKVLNRPWMSNKQEELEDEIIVGGQYAEPPARAVPKSRPYLPMYGDDYDEDSFPALHGYVDFESPQSANQSPYSNYKHSNMAFSPQNLNDAFSIVDK